MMKFSITMLLCLLLLYQGCSNSNPGFDAATPNHEAEFYDCPEESLFTEGTLFDIRLNTASVTMRASEEEPDREWPFLVVEIYCFNKTRNTITDFQPTLLLNPALESYLYTGILEYPFEAERVEKRIHGYTVGCALADSSYTKETLQQIEALAHTLTLHVEWTGGEESITHTFPTASITIPE